MRKHHHETSQNPQQVNPAYIILSSVFHFHLNYTSTKIVQGESNDKSCLHEFDTAEPQPTSHVEPTYHGGSITATTQRRHNAVHFSGT